MANVFVKIGADDSDLQKTLKKTAKDLQKWGKSFSQVGRDLTQALTLPIAGAAASFIAFSEKSKAAFESLGSSVKTSLGKVGDDIAKSINLQGILNRIAVVVNNLTKAFMSLPDETKRFVVVFATIVAVVGPVLLIVGKLLIALGALVGLLSGPLGLVVALGVVAAAWIGYSVASNIASESIFSSQEALQKEIELIEKRIDANRRLAEDLRKEKTGSMEWEVSGVSEASDAQLALAEATEKTVEADQKRIEDLNKVIELYGRWQVEIDETNRRLDIISKTMGQYDDLMEDVRVKTALYGETSEVLGQKLNGLLRTQEGLFKAGLEGSKIYNKVRDAIEDTTDAINKQTDATKRLGVYQSAATAGRTYEIQGGGVNPIAASRDAMMGRYNQMASDNLKLGIEAPTAEMRALRVSIEELQDPWSEFVGLVAASAPIWQQLGQAMHSVVQAFTQGVGDAIAQVLVYGQSLGKMMADLMKRIAAMIISTLVQIAIQWVISSLLGVGAIVTQTVAAVKAYAIQTWAGAFAATAAIPIVGPGAAFGAATAALATMLAGVPAAGAAGMGVGAASMATAAEGGIFTQPGITRIAERGRPEVVLNETNIKRFFPGMIGGGFRDRFTQIIQLNLDSRILSKVVAKGLPDIIRGM